MKTEAKAETSTKQVGVPPTSSVLVNSILGKGILTLPARGCQLLRVEILTRKDGEKVGSEIVVSLGAKKRTAKERTHGANIYEQHIEGTPVQEFLAVRKASQGDLWTLYLANEGDLQRTPTILAMSIFTGWFDKLIRSLGYPALGFDGKEVTLPEEVLKALKAYKQPKSKEPKAKNTKAKDTKEGQAF